MPDTTEMSKEEFDFAYPPGSETRREELVKNPRPQDELVPQSSADLSAGEYEEFLAWKEGRGEDG
jgi:hypothetical protein